MNRLILLNERGMKQGTFSERSLKVINNHSSSNGNGTIVQSFVQKTLFYTVLCIVQGIFFLEMF